MDAFSDPSVETVVVMSSAQIGKTEILNNVIGYFVDYDPSPILVVEPTIEVGKAYSKDRLSSMIRDTPCLTGKVREARSRDSDNTTLHKKFKGGHITIAGANSAASLRARPIRVVLCDDVDAFPVSAGSEGDPVNLAEKRTTTFWNRKIGLFSTPTVDGESRIQAGYEQSDKRKYWVPCPHCGKFQLLIWNRDNRDRMRWPKGEPLKATYHCRHCDEGIGDADKAKMIRQGEWRAEGESLGIAGFWLNELYSPWVSFGRLASRFMEAKDSPGTLQVFINTSLGETWKQVVISKGEEEILKARVDLPPQVVPADVVALTCGIDHQKYGFWFVVRAWSRDMTSWLIHYGFLPTWADVEKLLYETEYPDENGGKHRIWRVAIDTGGGEKDEGLSMTEETYWWIVRNVGRGVALWGTKGSSHPIPGKFRPGEELLKTPTGKRLPHWFRIILVDTSQMKDLYHYGIEQAAIGGANAIYLHKETAKDYALQILAEEKRRDKDGVLEWKQIRKDNHLLDAEVLALSVAQPQWIGGGVNLVPGRKSLPDKTDSQDPVKVQAKPRMIRSKWMEAR